MLAKKNGARTYLLGSMKPSFETSSSLTRWVLPIAAASIVTAMSFYLAFAIWNGSLTPFRQILNVWPLIPILIFSSLAASFMFGLSKFDLQSFDIKSVRPLLFCTVLLVLTTMSLSFTFNMPVPRSIPFIFGGLFAAGHVLFRVATLFIVYQLQSLGFFRTPVAIYGAGSAGIQLVAALRHANGMKPVVFFDDNVLLQKQMVAEIPVYSPSKIAELFENKRFRQLILALPSISRSKQREIIRGLKDLPCKIQVLPSFGEMIEGKSLFEDVGPVLPEDLLERSEVELNLPDVTNMYKGKTILVAGAGGSIGSELCRQILKYSPNRIVLLDRSEFALYTIEQNLRGLAKSNNVILEPVLGSVCDEELVSFALKKYGVQVVLHAAAYKHVPLVEMNELAGLHNNVIGTQVIAKASEEAGVERFVLISTDKAVRPTNVMGASKRLAELVVQDIQKRSKNTIFSMVRFGNVLGSSGSVIPLFHDQISRGGPLTLTHENITRFFMSASEAARLVLTASGLAVGGDVFVLDMGNAVKIKDLAVRMVELSGLTIKDENNPDGDIEIQITGLRPGEKLYEELLIGDASQSTAHPKILCANEPFLSELETAKILKDLRLVLGNNDVAGARDLISRWVDGYHQASNENKSIGN